ncbi:MAG TPA: branched-chain amino acid ABC transporter permease [Acidimicrobiales bacterium]|jgi:branched-chain amino acid transport system permease protein|nr:branched-chain amino acid ABC transporter permease [Acidimicrobiales bacterium]
MTTVLQVVITGVLLGLIYTLIGAGLTIVLGVLRIVNLSQGILVVIGSFLAFDLFVRWGIDPILSVLILIPVFFVVGALAELLFVRVPARDSSSRAMLVLFGLMMVGEAVATLAWTTDSRSIAVGYANGSIAFSGIVVPEDYLIMAGVAIAVLGLTELLLYRTMLGKALRAVGQNRQAAEVLGIDSAWMATVVFGLGTALAGAAGAALGVLFPFSTQLDSQWLAYSFIVVLIGGLGGVRSSLVGGLALGVGQAVFSQVLPLDIVPVVLYGILAAALIVRGGGIGLARVRRI